MKKLLKSKVFWLTLAISLILVVAGSGIYIMNTIYSHINYSRNEAHVIALKRFPGTIVESEIELEDLYIYYELEIVDHNQNKIELTVSGYDGTIISYEYKGV